MIGESVLAHFQRGTGTHDSRLSGLERYAGEIRCERLRDGLRFLRRLQQAGAPLRQNGRNLVGVFFGDEVVETGLHFEHGGIERTVASIVGMQMESGGGGGIFTGW